MNNHQRSWIEINQTALHHTIQIIRSLIPLSTKLAVVVKSNAYGHGISTAQFFDQSEAVSLLCTAGLQEAIELREAGIKKPILVMSYLDADLEYAFTHTIQLGVATFQELDQIKKIGKKFQKPCDVHIKIDTGLSRRGFTDETAYKAINQIIADKHSKLAGIFTHLADNKNEHPDYTARQLDLFDTLINYIRSQAPELSFETHAQASACLPENLFNRYSLIRIGSAAYGMYKSEHQQKKFAARSIYLLPALTWKTKIIEIKTVYPGTAISYGCSFIATRTMRIGILPIGYFDGYPSLLSGRCTVYIEGIQIDVVGRITMNLIMIDLSSIPHAQVGDTVDLIGNQPGITAQEIAHNAQALSIELLSRLHPAISRSTKTATQTTDHSKQEIRPQNNLLLNNLP